MRIVTLLPSATELVCAAGLQNQLAGVTHECDFPPAVRDLPVVTKSRIPHGISSAEIDAQVRARLADGGALYALDTELLSQLRPELIVTQGLCEVCSVPDTEVHAAARALPGPPQVLVLDPASLDEVFADLLRIGAAANALQKAQAAVNSLQRRVATVRKRAAQLSSEARPRVAVLEWLHPFFNAGHWTPQLVEYAGGTDCLGNSNKPSEQISWEQLAACNADVIFIALCGFGLARSLQDAALLQNDPRWKALPAVQQGRVYVTDGNAYFSRSGPRLVDSLEVLAHALHPQLYPPPAHAPVAKRI